MKLTSLYVERVGEWKDEAGNATGHCGVSETAQLHDKEVINGITYFCTAVFFTVYGVEDTGESVAIGDFTTREFAEEMAEALRNLPREGN